MKRILALALALYAGSALAAVSATKHNMNNYTGGATSTSTTGTVGGGTGDVCYYCHAPHNTLAAAKPTPLWARNNPATGSYITYSSATISRNIAGAIDQLSLACLSCHDGTIAVNQTINGRVGGLSSDKYLLPGNTRIGNNQDISNDHPVSLNWNTAFAGLATTPPTGTFPLFNITGIGTQVIACPTCHEPHGSTGIVRFLRADPNSGSFCATCHSTK